jgi:hypothetical protein
VKAGGSLPGDVSPRRHVGALEQETLKKNVGLTSAPPPLPDFPSLLPTSSNRCERAPRQPCKSLVARPRHCPDQGPVPISGPPPKADKPSTKNHLES